MFIHGSHEVRGETGVLQNSALQRFVFGDRGNGGGDRCGSGAPESVDGEDSGVESVERGLHYLGDGGAARHQAILPHEVVKANPGEMIDVLGIEVLEGRVKELPVTGGIGDFDIYG